MKKALFLTALTVFLGVWLPWLAVGKSGGQGSPVPNITPATETAPQDDALPLDEMVSLTVLMPEGGSCLMNLREYLVGAVLGELPADFPQEAQKAQAVVCRTYALRQKQGSKHENGDICTDSACCQAWRNPADVSQERRLPGEEAVHATDGMVLTYEGKLIDATFFSGSGGRTEAAVAVWGTEIPYLQAVDSPAENAPYDGDSVEFTARELRLLLETSHPGLRLPNSPEDWFGELTHTPGGGVESLQIGGEPFSGKELRSLLGLRSTVFTVSVEDGYVRFTTRGYGHRVGMSQYGARTMALMGSSYEEILKHYYKGVELAEFRNLA